MSALKKTSLKRSSLVFLTLLSFSQTFAEIPDEIDYSKYWQIYVRDKGISDQLRSESNAALGKFQNLSNSVDANRRQQSSNRSQRASNDSERSDLIGESQRLNYEIPRLVSDEASLDRDNRDMSQRLNWLINERDRAQVEQDKTERDFQLARQRKEESERNLDRFEREASKFKNDLEDTRADIARNNQSLAKVEQDLQRLPGEIQKDKVELDRQRNILREAQGNVANAQREVDDLNSQLAPERERLRQSQGRAQQADRAADGAEAQLARLQSDKQRLGAQLEELRRSKQRNRMEGERLERELRKTEGDLAAARGEAESPERDAKVRMLEQKLAELGQAKAQNDAEENRIESQLQALRPQIENLDQQIAAASAQAQSLRQTATAAKAEVDSIQANVTALEQRIGPAQDRLRMARSKVDEAQGKVASLERELAADERSLADANNSKQQLLVKLRQLDAQENSLEAKLSQARRAVDDARNDVARWTNEFRNVGIDLDRKRAETARLNNEVNMADSRLRDSVDRQNSLRRTIQERRSRLAWVADRIAEIDQENPALDSTYSRLVAELPGLISARDAAQADYTLRNQKATAAESVSAASLAKYQEVRRRYEGLLASATEKGRSQGAPLGKSEGAPVGSKEGQKLGEFEGDRDGTAAGREWGRKQGAVDGQANGDKEGYAHGRNLPENIESGRVEGYAQGKADAEAQALKEDYPAARKARRAEILAKIPDKVENINIRPSSSFNELGKVQLIAFNSLQKALLNQVLVPAAELMVEVPVDPDRADCNVGYVDFVNACREAFKKAYVEQYSIAYESAHKVARKEAFEATYPKSFEAHKMDLYKDNYDPAYAAAYAAADLRGAADARAAGYAEGKKAGYAERIAGAREEARLKGIADEEAVFASSSVVRLLGAEIVSGSGTLVAGGDLSVRVALANYGGVPAEKGSVKIQVVPESGNVSIDSKAVALPALNGVTRFNVTNVAFGKVSTSAGVETVKLRVILSTSAGFREEKIVSIQTGLHIFSQIKVDMSKKPWVNRGLFAPKAHKIKVTVINPRSFSSKNGFDVSLELPKIDGFEAVIAKASTPALAAGQKADVELQYKINKKELAAGETKYPVKIRVYLNKRLSAEYTEMIDPVNGI